MSFEDRYHNPLGNGNRKVPTNITPDNAPMRVDGPHLAVSQVAQELPLLDQQEWRKGLFAPESTLEREGRLFSENQRRHGDASNPNSALYATIWAQNRLNSRKNAQKATRRGDS